MNKEGCLHILRIYKYYFLFVVIALIIGWFFERLFLFTFLIAVFSWLYHVYQLIRLDLALDTKGTRMPTGWGLWGERFGKLYQTKQRFEKRMKFLFDYIDLLKRSIDSLPSAVFLIDNNGIIEWGNKTTEEIVGIDSKSNKNRSLFNFIRSPELIKAFKSKKFNNKIYFDHFYAGKTAQYTCYFSQDNTNSDKIVAVIQNITFNNEMENIISSFMKNVTNEVDKPIQNINGNVSSIKNILDKSKPDILNEKDAELFDSLYKNANSVLYENIMLSNTVSSLFFLVKLEMDLQKSIRFMVKEEFPPVSVEGQIKDSVDEVVKWFPYFLSSSNIHEAVSEKEVFDRISVRIRSDMLIKVNPYHIKVLVLQLLKNSLQFSPRNTAIKISWQTNNEYGILSCKDHGVGIPEEYLGIMNHDSNPNYQQQSFSYIKKQDDTMLKGSGIGLSIIRSILNYYSASLTVSSKVGIGTKFICKFPLNLLELPK